MSEIITLDAEQEQKAQLGWRRPNKTFKCLACGLKLTVQDAIDNGAVCPKCYVTICKFCGCSDDAGCSQNGLSCEWSEEVDIWGWGFPLTFSKPNVCTFCYFIIAEEMYLVATERGAEVSARYPFSNLIF